MGIGVSLFLLALGAILSFAVHVPARGIDVNTIGVILMLVGALGLLASLIFWSDWAPWAATRRRSTVMYDDVGADDVYIERPRTYAAGPVAPRRRRTVYRREESI